MKGYMKIVNIAILLALAFAGLGNVSVANAAARTISWVVSVTYQNVGEAPTTVNVDFYPENNGTPISFDPLNGGELAAGAGTSLYIGNVTGISGGFRGSAVMSSSSPLVATVVQFHQNAAGETVKMRMLSNGFSSEDGSNQFLLATVLSNTFQRTSVFSVQNTETESVNATIQFFDLNGAPAGTKTYTIPGGSSKYIEMDNAGHTGLPTTFNGSAIVTAVLTSNTSQAANVVSSVVEYYTTRNVASAFEGVPLSSTGQTLYLATGLCGSNGLDTFYAIQNASTDTATDITVQYYDQAGNPKAKDGPYTLQKGQKKSIITCSPSDGTSMTGFSGSAKVTSTATNIAAIGRAQLSQVAPVAGQADLFTAFLGQTTGGSKLALPFVRFSNDANYKAGSNYGAKQRTFLAIQNLEGTTINVNVKYYDKNGNIVATEPLQIAGNSKGNSSALTAGALGKSGMVAGEFGYYTDGTFGGSVIIEADASNPTAQFIAIARTQNPGAGEDYNAFTID